MINLLHHPQQPGELLARRLAAIAGRPVTGLPDRPSLDHAPRVVAAGAEIVRPDAGPPAALMVLSGVAGETRLLPDGRRQVVNLRLPGDILQPDVHESVTALSAVEVVDILAFVRGIAERGAENQGVRRAWLALARFEQALLRDHIVRLGRQSAYERMIHALVEIHERLLHLGLATASAFHLPIRQEVMADYLGLSVVHLSRTTQQLQRDHLIQVRSGYVTLLDRERLVTVSGYVSRFGASMPVLRPRSYGEGAQEFRSVAAPL